jgi:hypothetical protein
MSATHNAVMPAAAYTTGFCIFTRCRLQNVSLVVVSNSAAAHIECAAPTI